MDTTTHCDMKASHCYLGLVFESEEYGRGTVCFQDCDVVHLSTAGGVVVQSVDSLVPCEPGCLDHVALFTDDGGVVMGVLCDKQGVDCTVFLSHSLQTVHVHLSRLCLVVQ